MTEKFSHEEFENYLTLLSRMLQLRNGQTEAIAEELRVHLEERLGELTDRGVDPKKAVNIALGEFGDASALASRFTEISRMKRRRVMMRSMIGGFCIAMVVFAAIMSVLPEGQTNLISVAQADTNENENENENTSSKNSFDMSQADRDNQEIREKLKKKIDADFVENPLDEVLTKMERLTETQFYLDQKSFEEIGYTSDTPVTLKLKNVPAELVLRLIFDDLNLAYYLDSGIVIVTSQVTMQSKHSVQMYDVKSLLCENKPPKPAGAPMGMGGAAPNPDPQMMGGGMMGPGMMGGGPMMGNMMTPELISQQAMRADSQELCHLIQAVVEPGSWEMYGGPGTLSIYRGILVVRQTEAVHDQVGQLLDQLREKLKDPSSKTDYSNATYLTPQPSPAFGHGGMGMGMGGMPHRAGMMGGSTPPTKSSKPKKK